jgi:exodeoxyribonuclease VII large subunit
VTSPAAAALRDVLASLERRVPHLPVTLYPAAVQGADAGPLLARALNTASQRAQADGVDLILLVRGGGSMEDLWAFNDEGLARAIRACTVPVISGVGHETDFTIADFAADLRAATPTGAAELASAGFHAMHAQLAAQASLLQRAMMRRMDGLVQRVDRATLRLVHPRERLRNATRDLAGLQNRLASAMRRHLEQDRSRHAQLALRIKAGRPDIARAGAHVERLGAALRRAVDERLAAQRTTVDTLAAYLQHLDPQAVLGRGYSITRDAHGHILRDATASRPGDPLRIQLAHGQIEARVEDVKP